MGSVLFDGFLAAVGIFLFVALPGALLVWVPVTFKPCATRRTGRAVFAVLLLGGVTASQIALVGTGPVVCAFPFALAGSVELFYLLGWLFWERKTGMSTLRRTGYMLLIYFLIMGNVAVGWWAYSWIDYPQTRARAARAYGEMRTISIAIEVYSIDHKAYPPAVDINGKILFHEDSETGVSSGYVPWLLTTPTAYLSTIPMDPFHRTRKKPGPYGPYRYATNGSTCWIMVSPGPDENNDVRIEDFPDPEKANCDLKNFLSHFGIGTAVEYDGTNGTTSSGDILRVGP